MRDILERLASGKIGVDEAEREIRRLYVDQVGEEVRLDLERAWRRKVPEAILAEGKDPGEAAALAKEMAKAVGSAIVTRVMDEDHRKAIEGLAGEYQLKKGKRCFVVRRSGYVPPKIGQKIGILAAGTADLPLVEEAQFVAEEMGCDVEVAIDVGIAGIHRLFEPLKKMLDDGVVVLIVIAGMEGALPAVVASLVDVPVIGVPSSVGYGYGGKGEAALMSMLQACPMGVSVVNIDGGVAAGAFAALIANKIAEKCRNS
ncbi:MAG TPA: nickel pincer cofactor biosynthesis protein LarB [Thermoprotei archaeon]|nr:nickel pincer cofactor biosynthesis protein LarB [Thermoprotei archaeon]